MRSKETIAIINTGKKDDLENQSNHWLTLYKNGKSIVIYDSLDSASNKKDNALDKYLQQDSITFKQIKRFANDEYDEEWTISLYRLGHQRGDTYSCGYFAALYRVMVALKKKSRIIQLQAADLNIRRQRKYEGARIEPIDIWT